MEKITKDKKTIQRRRMMRYFIEATYRVMEEEGIENVTIRKVSDLAGYNSATLYNYFNSLDNLIAFSSLRYLKNYSDDLKKYISSCQNSFEKYIKIWECFCKHSFRNPVIYHKIFFQELNGAVSESIKEYYQIFPEDLKSSEMKEMEHMLIGETIDDRTSSSLQKPIKDGFFSDKDEKHIREICILIYEGMLDKILSGVWTGDIEAAVENVIYHIGISLKPYLIK